MLIGGRSVVVHPIPAVTLAQMRFPGAPQGLKMACGSNSVNDSSFPTSRQGQIAGIRRAFHEARHRMEEDDEDEHEDRDGRGHGRWDPRNATLIGAIRGELPVHLHCYRAEDIANWISALKEFGVRIAAVHHAAEAYKISATSMQNPQEVVSYLQQMENENARPETPALSNDFGQSQPAASAAKP